MKDKVDRGMPMYADDLREDVKTDDFMGAGFEEAVRTAEFLGKNLVVGYFVKEKRWYEED